MRRFLNIVVVIGALGSTLCAFDAIKKSSLNIDIDSKKLFKRYLQEKRVVSSFAKIKDNGVEKTLLLPVPKIDSSSLNKNGKLVIQKGLIIDFIDKNINIDSFATEFGLRLKERLEIGYYIFENNSELDDTSLIDSILKWDKQRHKIKTIRPNWKMNKRRE